LPNVVEKLATYGHEIATEKVSTQDTPAFCFMLSALSSSRARFFSLVYYSQTMEILKNEVFSKEVQIGELTIEYSVIEKDGCRVTFTAKDDEHRRIWRTELTDSNGNAKIYPNAQEAINDANRKLRNISSLKEQFNPSSLTSKFQHSPNKK
jgi:hypothetical protein